MSFFDRKKEFWAKFEASIFEVINLALRYLKNLDTLPDYEDEINREFYFCLIRANHELNRLESPPFYEALNQPTSNDDQFRNARENKRPDFQWSITDANESDPLKSSKQYILECKRLKAPSGSRRFNENYVNHGVMRFISEGHAYAYGVESSAMLGYVQGLTIKQIQQEVNGYLHKINQGELSPKNHNEEAYRFNHNLKRTFPEETFRLEHFWVDISGK